MGIAVIIGKWLVEQSGKFTYKCICVVGYFKIYVLVGGLALRAIMLCGCAFGSV